MSRAAAEDRVALSSRRSSGSTSIPMRSATCGRVRGTGATAAPADPVSIVTPRLRADGPNPLAGRSEDASLTVDLQSQAAARAEIDEREPAVAGRRRVERERGAGASLHLVHLVAMDRPQIQHALVMIEAERAVLGRESGAERLPPAYRFAVTEPPWSCGPSASPSDVPAALNRNAGASPLAATRRSSASSRSTAYCAAVSHHESGPRPQTTRPRQPRPHRR